MKKLITLLLAAALVLSLAACGGGSDTPSNDTNTPQNTETPSTDTNTDTPSGGGRIESKGLFVLADNENFDLSKEENLSDRETYLIHVYDIIPDEVKNADMSTFNNDYTVKLNDVNDYDSITTYGGNALNSFITGSKYNIDREVGKVYAGDNSIRVISAFRINKNDINDNTTVEFSIDGSDIYNCNISFNRSDIHTVSRFDEIFNIENNPRTYQLASTMYVRAKSVQNGLNYFSNNGGISNAVSTLTSTVTVLSATSYEVSSSFDGSGILQLYDFTNENATDNIEISNDDIIKAVNETYPDISEEVQILLEQGSEWVNNTELCLNSDSVTEEMQQNAYNSAVALHNASNTIIEYFEAE